MMITNNTSIGSLFKSPGTGSDPQASVADHPTRNALYANAAATLTKPMTPEDLQKMTREVFDQMGQTSFVGAEKSALPTGAPSLTAPAVQLPEDPKKAASLLKWLLEIFKEIGNYTTDKLKNILSFLKSAAAARTEGFAQRSQEYADALLALEAAVASASTTEAQLQAARDRVSNAQQQLDSAEATLADLDPQSPEYQEALQVRDQARAALQQAQQQLVPARQAHEANVQAAAVAMEKVQRLGQQLEAVIEGPLPPEIEENMKRELDSGSKLSLLLMQVAEYVKRGEEFKISFDLELSKKMSAARQAYMDMKSEEYLEAVKKAEQVKKVGNCITKILTAVVVALAVVVTVATAGALAGLAVGAVGLTLLALEAKGVNVLGPIMDPLMKGLMVVLEPLAKLAGDKWEKTPLGMLVMHLIPPEYEEMAKMMAGMVIAMGLLVVGGMVLGAAVGPLLGKIMAQAGEAVSKVLGKVIDKLMEKIISPMLEKINSKLLDNAVGQQLKAVVEQAFKKLADFDHLIKDAFAGPKGQMWLARLQQVGVAVEFGNVAVRSGTNVAAGAFSYEATKAMSEVEFIKFISDQLTKMLTELVDEFSKKMQATADYVNSVLQIQQNSQAAANFISKQRF